MVVECPIIDDSSAGIDFASVFVYGRDVRCILVSEKQRQYRKKGTRICHRQFTGEGPPSQLSIGRRAW